MWLHCTNSLSCKDLQCIVDLLGVSCSLLTHHRCTGVARLLHTGELHVWLHCSRALSLPAGAATKHIRIVVACLLDVLRFHAVTDAP